MSGWAHNGLVCIVTNKPGNRALLSSPHAAAVEHGETHEIRNEGREALRTLNFYVPPGYTEDGEELPPGKS